MWAVVAENQTRITVLSEGLIMCGKGVAYGW